MTQIRKKLKVSGQSIIEYILVSVVFLTVGIGTFMGVIRGAARARQGATAETYYNQDTDVGTILNTGVDEADYVWPSRFGEYADDAEGFEGIISDSQTADAGGQTEGQQRSELYEYEPLDWSIQRTIDEHAQKE